MKILVTGAAGFIGYHLIKKMLDLKFEVVGLDNVNDFYDVDLKYARLQETGIPASQIKVGKFTQSQKYPGYKFVKMSIEDKKGMSELFANEQFEVVCHLAAQAGVRYSLENPFAYIESNLVGFASILECCRHNHVKHLVYASSSSVYGLNEKVPFSEEDRVDYPISLYAATKKANELLAHSYSHLYGIQCTGLRFFTVYGPWGRPDMAPFLFTKGIINKEPIKVFNNGDMLRDFTYIDDLVEGVFRVIKIPFPVNEETTSPTGAPYRILNIGNSKPVRLSDFISCIEEATGVTAVKQMYPMQPGDVTTTYADTSLLEKHTGYHPSTTLSDGVSKYVEWFKAYYIS